jgi:hypothetical protein
MAWVYIVIWLCGADVLVYWCAGVLGCAGMLVCWCADVVLQTEMERQRVIERERQIHEESSFVQKLRSGRSRYLN